MPDALEEYNCLAAVTEVRSRLPRRGHRKVYAGLMRYSWPSRGYWQHILLGRAEAWVWFRTLNGPAAFKGALSLAIRRWHD